MGIQKSCEDNVSENFLLHKHLNGLSGYIRGCSSSYHPAISFAKPGQLRFTKERLKNLQICCFLQYNEEAGKFQGNLNE